ncbi:MFS transporter [Alkalilimnicola ehrlichii MLHE-1]|uniref:Major facilitator superfamily MFS_1 n=1 Tax=Alkalilimnicola ehrlichii (strain ATCC BAA-1101 / DSM 17681 / MLHE-1) TaxID=187272 RepID=Q0A500_ALKEH|nr:MFS transporter [Alkalilimnicola ehrlichii]ABI58087.1 major facilitator superfamily MFS_1 [Alkalilimnicola ehrlichii MLHE-1]
MSARTAAKTPLNAAERRAAMGLAGVFGLRMFGLFLILPVFALYAPGLEGATPLLIGLALGVYGLTQACLQIPMGMASDRWGRKPVIAAGLVVFAIGSVVAATADGIWGVILGRALQGGGAIAAAVMALAADVTRETHRARAFAAIGMSVGLAFLLALMVAPPLTALGGLQGLFWLTAGASLVGLVIVARMPRPARPAQSAVSGSLRRSLTDPDLMRLNVGIFVLHAALTGIFVALPLLIQARFGLEAAQHWRVWVPLLITSVAGMLPLLIIAERRGAMHRLIPLAVTAMALGLMGLGLLMAAPVAVWLVALWLYFVSFNLLEAAMPSLVSRFAPGEARGAAMGVYASAQFLGAFAGGLFGGILAGAFGPVGVMLGCAAMVSLWALLARGQRAPLPVGTPRASEGSG